jgi:surfeit locus 1 family protein
MFSKKWIIATALVLVGAAVCVRLGIWQLDRLDQRRTFNAHYTSMRALPALDISAGAPADIATMEYRAVTVRGTYDFANQVAIRNQYYNDMLGFDLLTPLRLASGTTVLVDRGWIGAQGADSPGGWTRFDGPEQVEVQGRIRLGQAAPPFGGLVDPTLTPGQTRLDFWNFVNLDRLAKQMPYPILPVYIQQTTPQTDSSLPIPHPEEIEITEGPHLGYAIQWFSFATIFIVGYSFYLRKHEAEPVSK